MKIQKIENTIEYSNTNNTYEFRQNEVLGIKYNNKGTRTELGKTMKTLDWKLIPKRIYTKYFRLTLKPMNTFSSETWILRHTDI